MLLDATSNLNILSPSDAFKSRETTKKLHQRSFEN